MGRVFSDRAAAELLDLVRRVLSFSAAARATSREVLDELGLTESVAGLLWMLDPAVAPQRMRELARRLGCDPSNVTLIGDRLVLDGLAERRRHPSDGRARVLLLTDAGIELREALLKRLVDTSTLTRLSLPERRSLAAVLDRLEGD